MAEPEEKYAEKYEEVANNFEDYRVDEEDDFAVN